MSEKILESQLFDIIKDEEMAENIKLAKIDMLIRLGVDVNAMYGAKSALKLANEVNNQKVIEFLENNGAKDIFDEEIAQKLGWDLIEVCENGEKKDVEELIDKGADVNQKDEDGNTALMRASYWGYKEVVELLIQNGADVHSKSNNGNTALMRASYWGYKEVVELLIRNGADVNQKDEDGNTALMRASCGGRKEVVELLIQKGADVNAKSVTGDTALIIAKDEKIKKAIIDAVKKRNEKTEENVIIQGVERE
ncbi:MAG: ankyrin repeat domain-containing protein [Alphaproteobacteria bacterium]|nr:ankyrin repeat domain-containing protein [Alphaproteobacteria bacterium]